MILQNQSSQKVQCLINKAYSFILEPHEVKEIAIPISSQIELRLEHIYSSCYASCFGWNMEVCQLVLDADFYFVDVKKETTIRIWHEKVHFELGNTYDRFFCVPDQCHLSEEVLWANNMEGMNEIASSLKKDSWGSRIGTFLFINLGGSTVLFLILTLICQANQWRLSWLWLGAFWAIAFLLQLLGEKIWYKIIPSDKVRNLQKYSSPDYIKSYYHAPNRTWIGNDILVDPDWTYKN